MGLETLTPENKGGLYAVKLEGGRLSHSRQEQWLLPVRDTLDATGNWWGVASSPVAADGIIYVGGLDGKLYAVRE